MELQTDVSGLAKKSPDTEETFYLPGVFEVKFLKTYWFLGQIMTFISYFIQVASDLLEFCKESSAPLVVEPEHSNRYFYVLLF